VSDKRCSRSNVKVTEKRKEKIFLTFFLANKSEKDYENSF
jgi:hypothetical protein